jgi:hypothetical protein
MKTFFALLLLVASALAQNNSGTLVIAPVRPQSVNDTFPSAVANEIQGGPFSVSNVAAMSNIPTTRLVPGALAYVTNDSTFRVVDNSTNWTSIIRFAGLINSGDFTNSSGTIYGLKTNVGPFEGVGNFLASNNTTLSNETLFRVGLAEETNRSAQFGFRVARTNNGGEGFAVFSVFGYNALAMIGPSDRSRSNSITNTNASIEADIFSISTTNKVATLIDTNTGATLMHRPVGFNSNATTPANTTNVVGWIQFYVGTNSVRVPYYQ